MFGIEDAVIESVLLTTDNTIEVVVRYPSNEVLDSHPPKHVPDQYVKQIYGVVDGKIELVKQIKGKYKQVTEEVVKDKLVFE